MMVIKSTGYTLFTNAACKTNSYCYKMAPTVVVIKNLLNIIVAAIKGIRTREQLLGAIYSYFSSLV